MSLCSPAETLPDYGARLPVCSMSQTSDRHTPQQPPAIAQTQPGTRVLLTSNTLPIHQNSTEDGVYGLVFALFRSIRPDFAVACWNSFLGSKCKPLFLDRVYTVRIYFDPIFSISECCGTRTGFLLHRVGRLGLTHFQASRGSWALRRVLVSKPMSMCAHV